LKKYTSKELLKCDGQGGRPAYVAVNGTVYDVSQSDLWKHGLHFQKHIAGRDLTAAIQRAPHSVALLKRLPVVGELDD